MNKRANNTTMHLSCLSQRGLSLIELMISITIGLLILVSLSSMFVNQSRARAELDKSNRMIDNGRYALELLSSSVRMAGFFGNYGPSGAPAAWYSPCDIAAMTDPVRNIDLLRVAVQGYDAASVTGQVASPPCSLTNSPGSALSLKAGSDIFAVRRASTVTKAVPPPQNGTVYLQVSSCQYDTIPYLMSAIPTALTMGQKNINGTGNCISAAGITTITAPYEVARNFMVEVYFISPDNNVGDGIPTLKRRELTFDAANNTVFATTPLVEGIEFMQVDYGIDANLDGTPDSYDSCSACSLDQWSNVVAVRLSLVARNTEITRGYSDPNTYSLGSAGNFTPSGAIANYKRHAYTQTIRLVNPSGRRETP